MQTIRLPEDGLEISRVGLGAWAMGGWFWGGAEDAQSVEAIHAALDLGLTLIDTAPVYGFGHSEEVVGRALRGCRDKAIVSTKCGLVWDRPHGKLYFEAEGHRICKCLKPQSIRDELDASLKRLGTDRVDIYHTHWPDEATPIADTMETLVRLKEAGKIRAIAASNAAVDHMKQYLAGGRLSFNQLPYSMLDRRIEAADLPFCRDQGIGVLSYSPIAQGFLTGKMQDSGRLAKDDYRRNSGWWKPKNLATLNAFLERLRPIAGAHGLTLAQLAIAWNLAQPGVACALVGARSAAQVGENAAAADAALSADDLDRIRAWIEELPKVPVMGAK